MQSESDDDPGLVLLAEALLAEALDRFGERLDGQTTALTDAVTSWNKTTKAWDVTATALRRDTRRSWVAIAALTLAVTVAVALAFLWVSETRNRERAECIRDNQTRAAVVEASRLGVRTSMGEVTGDLAEARRVGDLTAQAVADDPALQPRQC